MRGLLISRERKRDQSLEKLINIQEIARYKTLSENFIRISGRRSTDQVQDLRSYLLREDCDSMIKLCLAYQNILNIELPVSLRKPYFRCMRPESRQFHGCIGGGR